MKNVMHLIVFQMKTNKKQIWGWTIAIFGIVFLYMILFPSVQDMAQIKMEAMPEELMQFMGMGDFSDLSNYTTYFGMIYNMILIAISIFATVLGAGILTKEEKSKTIEFLYAQEISRKEIYYSKFFTAYLGVMVVIVGAVFAAIMCGYINGGETFQVMELIQIVKATSITPFIFLSIGTMLAGITAKVSGASIGSGLVILCYVIGFLSTMVADNLTWLQYISPFEVLNPTKVMTITNEIILPMCGYFTLMVLFVVVGSVAYQKRDFE